MSVNVLRATLQSGRLAALTHTIVQKSWLKTWFPAAVAKGPDFASSSGAADTPYDIPNLHVGVIDHEHSIPVGSWRAPNTSWNGFVTESFIDELAHATGADPLAFRLRLLGKTPRAAVVLRLAAEKAHWGTRAHGHGQGIALVNWDKSFAAMVADITMQGATPVVHGIVAAVDCGRNVNPDIVLQQCRSAAYFGLSAALTGKITITNGRVDQHNFYDYTVLRMAQAPRIDVYIVPSDEDPSGIGELLTPPIAPAISNAMFSLTGKRIRELPFPTA
jgi:isoquinoline 1-oxidoreductase beta subunit